MGGRIRNLLAVMSIVLNEVFTDSLSSAGSLVNEEKPQQVVNHGIEDLFLDEVRQLAREFFHLPMAEKQKYARRGDGYEGYGNDLVVFEKQPFEWTDRLYLQVAPEDHQKLEYWPQKPESFKVVLKAKKSTVSSVQNKRL